MHVASVAQSEIKVTLEVAIAIVNELDDDRSDPRARLIETGFTRAENASEASIQRLSTRLANLAPLLDRLPEMSVSAAMSAVNEELTELRVSPSVVDHDGVGAHIHWTPSTATFDDQVITDVLMALAQEFCDGGTSRFGRCDADGCQSLFFDGTRNHSRRFCSDPRCASRTHTADHRARLRAAD